MLKKSSSKALEIAPVIVEVEAALEVEEAEEVSEVAIVVVTVVAEVEEVEWVEEVEEVEVKIEANLQTLTLTLSKTVTSR
jgi:hypothetical protein